MVAPDHAAPVMPACPRPERRWARDASHALGCHIKHPLLLLLRNSSSTPLCDTPPSLRILELCPRAAALVGLMGQRQEWRECVCAWHVSVVCACGMYACMWHICLGHVPPQDRRAGAVKPHVVWVGEGAGGLDVPVSMCGVQAHSSHGQQA